MKIEFDQRKLERKIKRVSGPKSLIRAAQDIRQYAQRSIKKRTKNAGYSAPGQPPLTANPIIRYRYRGETIYTHTDGKNKVVAKSGRFVGADKAKNIEKISRKRGLNGTGEKEQIKGLMLRRSILWGIEGDRILIGPTASGIGNIGRLHEFGGTGPGGGFAKHGKRSSYARRPFMSPALNKIKAKLPWYVAKNMELK